MADNSTGQLLLTSGVFAAFIASIATLLAQWLAYRSQKSLARRNARSDYLHSTVEALRALREAAIIPYSLSSGIWTLANDDMAQPIEFLVKLRDWFLRLKTEYENARHYFAVTDRANLDTSLVRTMKAPYQSFDALSSRLEDELPTNTVSADLIPRLVEATHEMLAFARQVTSSADEALAQALEELSTK